MRHYRIGWRLFAALLMLLGHTATAHAQSDAAAFRCQARVTLGEADPASLRDRTRQALLTNGVEQAVASLLTPEEAKRMEAALRKNVYARPDRYITTYQIFSEQAQAHALEMTGEITVALDLLRSDLNRLGAQGTRSAATSSPAPSPIAAPTPAPTSMAGNPVAPHQAPAASGPVSPATTLPEVNEPPLAPGREVLWVVAEHWKEAWVLPQENGSETSPFFVGVTREISDYGWSLVAPRAGSLGQQTDGGAVIEDALALAAAMAIPIVASGRMSGQPGVDGSIVVNTELNLIEVAGNQSLGTIHQQWQAVGVNEAEASMQLANLVVPGIDQILSRRAPAAPTAGSASGAGKAPPVAAPGTEVVAAAAGEQVIEIRGHRPYAVWEALQAPLTAHSGSLRVTTLELTPHGLRAHVTGADLNLFTTFNGYQLNNQLALRVDQVRPAEHTITFSTVPAGQPTEAAQEEQPLP